MWSKGFQGWYLKHQGPWETVAFIPGQAETGAFVQMISTHDSRQFPVSEWSFLNGTICADRCRFSRKGCSVDLPGVRGALSYGDWTPLRSDIMGPFRFFPMECRHGILSMTHSLHGSLTIDGISVPFENGLGYVETDRGVSFPSAYLWLQCNDFSEPCSLMISIARIPFCGTAFTGCICAILHGGKEYRLATYLGVRILAATAEHIRLAQGKLLLEADLFPAQAGHPLASPLHGKMTGVIRESHMAAMDVRLWAGGQRIFSLHSSRASYECAAFHP